jgi:hypothetical protein
MAAAAILEIEVRAMKWAITTRFDANWYTQTKKSMPGSDANYRLRKTSSEITKPEALAKFQDYRRRHFVN